MLQTYHTNPPLHAMPTTHSHILQLHICYKHVTPTYHCMQCQPHIHIYYNCIYVPNISHQPTTHSPDAWLVVMWVSETAVSMAAYRAADWGGNSEVESVGKWVNEKAVSRLRCWSTKWLHGWKPHRLATRFIRRHFRRLQGGSLEGLLGGKCGWLTRGLTRRLE